MTAQHSSSDPADSTTPEVRPTWYIGFRSPRAQADTDVPAPEPTHR